MEEQLMPANVLTVVDGPDKPALQRAIAYPERERVHFRLERDGVDVQLLRMDEIGDGFSFRLRGVVRSGPVSGATFDGSYSVETRSGSLQIVSAV